MEQRLRDASWTCRRDQLLFSICDSSPKTQEVQGPGPRVDSNNCLWQFQSTSRIAVGFRESVGIALLPLPFFRHHYSIRMWELACSSSEPTDFGNIYNAQQHVQCIVTKLTTHHFSRALAFSSKVTYPGTCGSNCQTNRW